MPANMITNKRLLGTFVLLLTITFCIGFLVVQAQAGTVFSIESTDPADGQSGVPVSAEVTIEFSDYAKEGSGFGNITFTGGGKDVDFITSGLPGYELVISPQDPLSMSTEYTVTIPKNAVQDDNENPLDKDYTITFFTKGLPDVQTSDATGVTAIAAQLNGQLTNDGGEPCSVKFAYKKTSETTWNEQA
ncbi:MAG: Ig-like domain-containing protein, partial [Bacillota bacterium]